MYCHIQHNPHSFTNPKKKYITKDKFDQAQKNQREQCNLEKNILQKQISDLRRYLTQLHNNMSYYGNNNEKISCSRLDFMC